MADRALKEIVYRWRVRTGTFAILAVLIFARPQWTTLAAGFAVSLLGLGLRAWAAGHLRKEKELAISGPYRRTRNPLYLGNMLIGAGIAVGAWSWGSLAVLIVYFFIFYPVVIREERDRMRRLFPEAYESYEKHVPLFFMGFRKNGHSDTTAFSWELYRKNKETRALIGTAVFWVVLAARMLV